MENGKPLKGHVALITGASRGIGLAIAEQLAGMGARLSLCARGAADLDRAAAALRHAGAEVFAAAADMTRAADIARFAEETQRNAGPVDILVNNAGVGRFGAFHELTEEDWDAVLDTNLKGVFLLSRAIAPSMIERKTGHIINIASLAGKNAFVGRQHLLRIEMGAARADELHGGGFARLRDSGDGDLPRIGGYGVFAAFQKEPGENGFSRAMWRTLWRRS